MRLKFQDAAREVTPASMSTAELSENARRRARGTSGNGQEEYERARGTSGSDDEGPHLGYPANYPVNGANDSGGGEALVGRWHKSLFDCRDTGEHIEVWRKPDMTAADVHDAAARSQIGGLKALNALNRKHYGS